MSRFGVKIISQLQCGRNMINEVLERAKKSKVIYEILGISREIFKYLEIIGNPCICYGSQISLKFGFLMFTLITRSDQSPKSIDLSIYSIESIALNGIPNLLIKVSAFSLSFIYCLIHPDI